MIWADSNAEENLFVQIKKINVKMKVQKFISIIKQSVIKIAGIDWTLSSSVRKYAILEVLTPV